MDPDPDTIAKKARFRDFSIKLYTLPSVHYTLFSRLYRTGTPGLFTTFSRALLFSGWIICEFDGKNNKSECIKRHLLFDVMLAKKSPKIPFKICLML